ncbi:MAG: GAF domain-containing protein [Desulfobacteraceae bacterium]|jgi:signal transduction protein with GAF and PtsI domain|nr:MAG: GAF domain-containing protein [Desulfobacteraceae bacterium]
MDKDDKITIDIFKIVTKAVAESDNFTMMLNHLTQLLVATLQIKGCAVMVLNPEKEELEFIASFGLSTRYLSKGPIKAEKSVGCTLKGEPVLIEDISDTGKLQYPEAAKKEGIASIASIPIFFMKEVIGVLRLYHRVPWKVSERDVESLIILGEAIGLAMMFTRLANTLKGMREAIRSLPRELDRFLGR